MLVPSGTVISAGIMHAARLSTISLSLSLAGTGTRVPSGPLLGSSGGIGVLDVASFFLLQAMTVRAANKMAQNSGDRDMDGLRRQEDSYASMRGGHCSLPPRPS